MDALLNGGSLRNDRDQQQRIIPHINFTCDGSITKWIVGAKWDASGQRVHFPDLQVWRSTGENVYTRVGSTTLNFASESATGIYEFTPSEPVEFHNGDILGIFQPSNSNSRLRLFYEENNGPTNYYEETHNNDVDPPSDTFTITEGMTSTQNDLPLITVEISKLLVLYSLCVDVSISSCRYCPAIYIHPTRPIFCFAAT